VKSQKNPSPGSAGPERGSSLDRKERGRERRITIYVNIALAMAT